MLLLMLIVVVDFFLPSDSHEESSMDEGGMAVHSWVESGNRIFIVVYNIRHDVSPEVYVGPCHYRL